MTDVWRTVTGCYTCGGFGSRHDPIQHGWEPSWTNCLTCKGDGCVRDSLDLDVTCGDCGGEGGWER